MAAAGIKALPAVLPCNVIVGPRNKWVTAAKSVVTGHCGINMLAGPSEVLVIARGTADAVTGAAKVIAQTEHNMVAHTNLVMIDPGVVATVEAKRVFQVDALPEPNHSTIREALRQSFSVLCRDVDGDPIGRRQRRGPTVRPLWRSFH